MNWRILTLLLLIGLTLLFGISLYEPANGGALSASTRLEAPPQDISGFARAIEPWDWRFPQDHGAHPDFQTEWWYYTGNVATTDDRRLFGYQFTIFRRALAPLALAIPIPSFAPTISIWRTSPSAISPITTISTTTCPLRPRRRRAGRRGKSIPFYRVWLEDWAVSALKTTTRTRRISPPLAKTYAIDLRLYQDEAARRCKATMAG